VPAKDFALALTAGQAFGGGEMNLARKLGVTDTDVDRLCERVLAALANGQLDPEALKAAAGSAVKHLGEEGKKKGLTSTLPVVLGIRRQGGEGSARSPRSRAPRGWHRRPDRPGRSRRVQADEGARITRGAAFDRLRPVRLGSDLAAVYCEWCRPPAGLHDK